MIHRFVQMTFQPNEIQTFLNVFEESKQFIRQFPGCKSLQLIQNQEHPNIICTSSIWNSVEDLENYRHSDLFKTTWSKTKVLFSDKPKAISYHLLDWQP